MRGQLPIGSVVAGYRIIELIGSALASRIQMPTGALAGAAA